MVDYAYLVWRPPAHIHFRKLQVLQSECLRIATNTPSYVCNKQMHEDLEVPFFRQNVRELTEGFDSKFAGAGDTIAQDIGSHLCWLRADRSRLSS